MNSLFVIAVLTFAPAAPPPVTALAYTADGKTLVAGMNRSVVLIDVKSGDVTRRMEASGPITGVVFSNDGKMLVLATGQPGASGEINIHELKSSNPPRIIKAHGDLIYGLSINGDGNQLATGSYDRLVKLYNLADHKEHFTLKDHADAVYAVVFQPAGKLLASVAADRSLKIWDTTTGKRLYSLTEATDWLSTLAFSPNGKLLAAAGVDKSIRIYSVDENEGKLRSSFFAHDGPVLRLVFAPDGQSLFSFGQDRVVKVWDPIKGTELRHFPPLPADGLVMALRPDGKQLAIGRHDGVLTLHDVSDGKITATLLPEKPKIAVITPDFGPRGQTVDVRIIGERLDLVTEITANVPGVSIKIMAATSTRVDATVTLDETLTAGIIALTAKSSLGDVKPIEFTVDVFPVSHLTSIDRKDLQINRTYVGALTQSGAVDEYRLSLQPEEEVGVRISMPSDSKLEPVLEWVRNGIKQGASQSALAIIGGDHPQVTLRIRDREFRGGKHFGYRLHVGQVPVVTGIYPLSIPPAKATNVELFGANLSSKRITVKAPDDAKPGSMIPLSVPGVIPPPIIGISEFPETDGVGKPMSVPGTLNGKIKLPFLFGAVKFPAKKGERLIVEALAQRYGSPLDPLLEILDDNGQPVERARLQCVAKTVMTLRHHPASSAAIRLENWNAFATDDFVWIGQELVRISELPGHPDADCDFYAVNGKRQTFFDTTPGWHPNGSAVYKVRIHTPNSPLAANGFPIIPLYYRNDDGGPGYGKDARVIFDPPADGFYLAKVTSAQNQLGDQFAYRLTVRPPKPDFAIKVTPPDPKVEVGGARAMTVTADRIDGYDGPISVRLDGLPSGFTCPSTEIEAGQTRATLGLAANGSAKTPETGELKLIGSAEVDGKSITHAISVGRPNVTEPGDIITRIEQDEVKLRPGHETTLKVRIERRNGFAGRVPLEVRNLPHGVRVLHIGLNGIMITEKETTRDIVLGAEPWVQEMTRPIIVVGKIEGKNSEHAAPPIPLHVVNKEPRTK